MRERRSRSVVLATGASVALLLGWVPAATASALPAGPCGLLGYDNAHRPAYQHVVVIMDENLSYASYAASPQATYLHGLAAACASETNMHAATHPSQPNYMAATSGVATSAGDHTTDDNVFHQLQAAGKTWKNYAESMPANCSRSSAAAPAYKTGHTPAFWYLDLATPKNTCALNVVPMSPALDTAISTDTLPTLAWITPDSCDDMHWLSTCSYPVTSRVAAGDDWLSGLIPRLTAMPSYQAGKTLIIVTFDEGEELGTAAGVDCTAPTYYATHPDCQIPMIVVSPYVRPGSVDSADHNLYSMLGTVQDILGLKRLGHAVGQRNLRSGLRF